MSERGLLIGTAIVAAAAVTSVGLVTLGGRDHHSTAALQPHVEQVVDRAPPQIRASARPRRSSHAHARPENDASFWRLVGEMGNADTARRSEILQERLTRRSPSAIIAFWRTRRRIDRSLYTWKLWGAATVIEDGCSDDCFRDFRAYIISLGPGAYERAVHHPDALAPVVQDAENGDWENADDVAPDAYSSRTGNDFPFDDQDLSGPPAGRRINLDGPSLTRRYPRLAARFRGT